MEQQVTSGVTSAAAAVARASSSRLQSIDAVRGAVMILMALDHVRDFVHSDAARFRPEDLAQTTPALFFTRWITHFCAPVFMLYAGAAAFLWASRGRTRGQLSRFLFTRGLWLVFLELTVVHVGFTFNFDYSVVILSVIWALGCSMIALSVLVYLPPRALAVLSIGMIALHNLLDAVKSTAWFWDVLHRVAPFRMAGRVIIPAYSLIPWIGVMAAGYCLGRVFLLEPDVRRKFLLRLGAGLTIAFILFRGVNVYGDPAPWSTQRSTIFTVLSFLNCTKYPPSLLFLLMTIGPALLVTGWLERIRLAPKNPLVVFGRVPLFYFLVHFWVIHGIAALLLWLRYGNPNLFWNPPPAAGGPPQAFSGGYGFNLWVCYSVWLAIVILVYPACLWFARLKQRRRDWWLKYC